MENIGCIDYIRKATFISERIFLHKGFETFDVSSSENLEEIIQQNQLTAEKDYAFYYDINSDQIYRLD